jgi:hypothetical protein
LNFKLKNSHVFSSIETGIRFVAGASPVPALTWSDARLPWRHGHGFGARSCPACTGHGPAPVRRIAAHGMLPCGKPMQYAGY